MARWMAPEVRKFRGSSAVPVRQRRHRHRVDLRRTRTSSCVTVIWSIIIAFKYAKLWNGRLRLARRVPPAARPRAGRRRGRDDRGGARCSSTRSAATHAASAARSAAAHAAARGAVPQQRPGGIDPIAPTWGRIAAPCSRAEQDRGEILRHGERAAAERSVARRRRDSRPTEALFQRIQVLAQAAVGRSRSRPRPSAAQIEAEISDARGAGESARVRGERGARAPPRAAQAAAARRGRRASAGDDDARAKLETCVARAAEHAARPDAPARRRVANAASTSRRSPSARARSRTGRRAVYGADGRGGAARAVARPRARQ